MITWADLDNDGRAVLELGDGATLTARVVPDWEATPMDWDCIHEAGDDCDRLWRAGLMEFYGVTVAGHVAGVEVAGDGLWGISILVDTDSNRRHGIDYIDSLLGEFCAAVLAQMPGGAASLAADLAIYATRAGGQS